MGGSYKLARSLLMGVSKETARLCYMDGFGLLARFLKMVNYCPVARSLCSGWLSLIGSLRSYGCLLWFGSLRSYGYL